MKKKYTPFETGEVKAEEPEKVDPRKLKMKELVELAEEKGIDIEGLKKSEIIEAIESEEEEDSEEEE